MRAETSQAHSESPPHRARPDPGSQPVSWPARPTTTLQYEARPMPPPDPNPPPDPELEGLHPAATDTKRKQGVRVGEIPRIGIRERLSVAAPVVAFRMFLNHGPIRGWKVNRGPDRGFWRRFRLV